MSQKTGTISDLGFNEYRPYIENYKNTIDAILNLQQTMISEVNENNILHNSVIIGCIKNALYTIIKETLKTFCRDVRPRIVTLDDVSAEEFYTHFLNEEISTEYNIDILVDVTKIVYEHLTT